jgi:hypothetical protein
MSQETEEKDWKITDKQRDLITKRIQHFSRKEASYCINLIEAIYLTRPSKKESSN